ncbi:MAG: benzoylformate decarboxylase [Actinomycetota bacterium]|jgi:benzoylformate decarboxylase
MKGRDVLLEVLATEGVRHVFGNPGTTELPFVDALASRDDPAYVLALQEATAVAMADGYAQATGRPAFLNLHTSAGLGNAIGNLTNAQANATPLVVTAGQQDRRHIASDPLLAGDLVGLARPVSKWAHEVRTAGELGVIIRRAFHDAAHAPAGPVFVSLPMDLLEEDTDAPVPAPSRIDTRVVPADLTELADLLASTERGELCLVAADEVAASGGVDALVAVAEALGCDVFGAPLRSNLVFPPRHPLWQGDLAPAAAAIRSTLSRYHRVLFVGGRAFMVYPYTPGPALPPEVELLHLSPDAHQLGRTWPTRLGVLGDPKATLQSLVPLLRERMDASASAAAVEAARSTSDARAAQLEDKATARYADTPMHPMAAAHALVRALPPESALVDEAITTGTYIRGFHHVSSAGRYFFCRGGGLGWGMPAALGVSLGFDREPVLCVVGDGSAMYSPQALWTAAHEQLPVVFAVVNNRQYLILKNALRSMDGDTVATGRYVGMDIVDPPVDYVALARSMGVHATLVEKAGDVGDAVRAAWDTGRPHLLELPITVP